MPELKGSCHCGAVSFTAVSHGRHPYMRCYCGICRKQDGGGGYAINLSADASTMKIEGKEHLTVYRAMIYGERSQGERNFCRHCGCALWLYDPRWPELIHPLASAIDGDLPRPPQTVHLMLYFKPGWVEVAGPDEKNVHFARYPEFSIEDWHRQHGLWEE